MLLSGSSLGESVTAGAGPSLRHTNEKSGSYAASRDVRLGEWQMRVEGWRCQTYGTIIRRGWWNYNYDVSVVCLGYGCCMAWEQTMSKLQAIVLAAIHVAWEDLRGGVDSKADLQKIMNKYKRCSFRNLLQTVV